jgi:hypothetical protein
LDFKKLKKKNKKAQWPEKGCGLFSSPQKKKLIIFFRFFNFIKTMSCSNIETIENIKLVNLCSRNRCGSHIEEGWVLDCHLTTEDYLEIEQAELKKKSRELKTFIHVIYKLIEHLNDVE